MPSATLAPTATLHLDWSAHGPAREDPRQATLSDGRIVVVWQEDSDWFGWREVMAQFYDASGAPLGEPFRVNTTIEAQQQNPDVIALPDGSFVVVWESFGQDSFYAPGYFTDLRGTADYRDDYVSMQFGIYQQHFAADGTPIGGETLVNTSTVDGNQSNVILAPLDDGGYLLTWTSFNYTLSVPSELYQQRFAANGQPVGTNEHVETDIDEYVGPTPYLDLFPFMVTPGVQTAPDGFTRVQGWGVADDIHLFTNSFDGSGGDDITIDDNGRLPFLIELADGALAIVWEHTFRYITGDVETTDIMFGLYSADGTALADVVRVDSSDIGEDRNPQIMALADGVFLITWRSDHTFALMGSIVSRDGTVLVAPLQLTPDGIYPNGWQISLQSEGELLLTAQSTIRGTSTVFTQRLHFDLSSGPLALGDGATQFDASPEDVVIDAGAGDDTVNASTEDTVVWGGSGNDAISGSAGADALRGGDGNDRLVGGDGGDLLEGGDGDDTLEGGAGNDTLSGGWNSNRLFGGAGDDLLLVRHVNSGVRDDLGTSVCAAFGGDGNDTLIGASGQQVTLDGNDGDDYLRLGDTMRGGAGNDTLVGGFEIDGGDGIDLMVTAAFRIDLGTGTIHSNQQDAVIGHFVNIEAIEFRSTDDFPAFNLTGSAFDDVVFYGYGDFHGSGGLGNDYFASTYVQGQSRASLVEGIGPFVSVSVISGDDGNDTMLGGIVDNIFHGGEGDDWLETLGYRDSLSGDAGNDTLIAGDERDTLSGGLGADWLEGGDGSDFMFGDAGNDTIFGGDTEADLRDLIDGGDGNDVIDSGFGNDEVRGGNGFDVISGGFGADSLLGGSGNDTLAGQAFSDQIFGGDGNDFINGGFGHDRIYGGAGADRFFHLGVAGHGTDWIRDYTGSDGDVLVFGSAGATPDQFSVNFATTPNAGDGATQEAFVIYRPTGQILWALIDGAANDQIWLQIGTTTYDLLA